MRVFALAFVLIVTAALAGCASKGGGDGDESSSTNTGGSQGTSGSGSGSGTSTSSGSSSASSTGTGSPPANAAPRITSFTGNSTGLTATFAFNATDDQTASLTYELSFGDATANATGTVAGMANATHAYAVAGKYNATLVVSDGTLAANQTLMIDVVAAGVGGGAQHEEADDLVAAQACQGFFFPDLDGIAQLGFSVDAATIGLPYTASVDGPGLAGIRLGFFDSGGANKGGTALVPGTSSFSGTVPEDAVTAIVVGCGGGPYSAVYDAGVV